MSPSSDSLTDAQSHALFDILVHHQLYAEIESFKYPEAIDNYGYPFRKDDGIQTTSPLLQNMLNKFALRLPGLNSVKLDFWQDKCRVLVAKLGEAELSESYDKGAIGARKALATAISSLLEYVSRGMLGGYPKRKSVDKKKQYDASQADDVLQAWDDGLHELIYGDLIDELFDKTAETGKLEDHSSLVQAAHEFILLNIASFMHHVFVMSPDGQYLLRLIENVHRLVPYTIMRNTLRVGNAATMINGMVRLILTKLSVTAVTNWLGLSNNSNDGMNLLQQIVSTVMAWDTAEFQRRASKLESAKDGPGKSTFRSIRAHVYAARGAHEAAREKSIENSKSIITAILDSADPPVDTVAMTDHQHAIAVEYYSTLLSIRDREELTKILCKLQPDLLTSGIKDLVAAYDPIIRGVHNAVDLSGTITDLESFLTDMIKVSKPRKSNGLGSRPGSRNNSRSNSPNPSGTHADSGPQGSLPTVEDFVQLVRKHIPSSHKFMHQVCKNAPELANQYREYAKSCAAEFRDTSNSQKLGKDTYAAGSMTAPVNSLFQSLPADTRSTLQPLLDNHEKHLNHLKSTSRSRLESIIKSSHSRPNSSSNSKHASSHSKATTHGPGTYLSRWHALLDATLITPATKEGRVRHGWEVKGELDGKGLKTDTLLKVSASGNGNGNGNGTDKRDEHAGSEIGGERDRTVLRERKRDGKEEVKTDQVWTEMQESWGQVLKGMEVMGP